MRLNKGILEKCTAYEPPYSSYLQGGGAVLWVVHSKRPRNSLFIGELQNLTMVVQRVVQVGGTPRGMGAGMSDQPFSVTPRASRIGLIPEYRCRACGEATIRLPKDPPPRKCWACTHTAHGETWKSPRKSESRQARKRRQGRAHTNRGPTQRPHTGGSPPRRIS